MPRGDRYDAYYDDYPQPPPQQERRRGYEEVDVDIQERRRDDRRPDFLRDDYGGDQAGPLVRRGQSRARGGGRDEEFDVDVRERGYERQKPRRQAPPDEEVDIDIWRGQQLRDPPPRRNGYEEREVDIDIRRGERPRDPSLRRNGYEEREIDIDIKRDERPREPPSRRNDYDEREIDIDIKRDERPRGPPPRRKGYDEREIDIDIRRDERPRAPEPPREKFRVDIDERSNGQGRSRAASRAPLPPREEEDIDIKFTHQDDPRNGHRDKLVIRERDRSPARQPPPGARPYARKREDFYYRRRSPTPPPPSPPPALKEEIVIRTRREPSPPPPAREPSPPSPEPVYRPPVIQEVITHHRTIDHGVIRFPRSPEPSPPPPRSNERRHLDLSFDRTIDSRGNTFEEDIHIRSRERDTDSSSTRTRTRDRGRTFDTFDDEINYSLIRRERSRPPPPPMPVARRDEINVNIDIDNDRALDRPRPPPPAPSPRPKEMWTEITRDLIAKEALDAMGYDYEVYEDTLVVFAKLREPDILRLADLSDQLQSRRRDRIEQIQWERQDPRLPDRGVAEETSIRFREQRPEPRRTGGRDSPKGDWDEVVREREVVFEGRRGDPGMRRRGY